MRSLSQRQDGPKAFQEVIAQLPSVQVTPSQGEPAIGVHVLKRE
jgi:hypothetical protein